MPSCQQSQTKTSDCRHVWGNGVMQIRAVSSSVFNHSTLLTLDTSKQIHLNGDVCLIFVAEYRETSRLPQRPTMRETSETGLLSERILHCICNSHVGEVTVVLLDDIHRDHCCGGGCCLAVFPFILTRFHDGLFAWTLLLPFQFVCTKLWKPISCILDYLKPRPFYWSLLNNLFFERTKHLLTSDNEDRRDHKRCRMLVGCNHEQQIINWSDSSSQWTHMLNDLTMNVNINSWRLKMMMCSFDLFILCIFHSTWK